VAPVATHTLTLRVANNHHRAGLRAVLVNVTTGQKYYVRVNKSGYAKFTRIPAGTYILKVITGHRSHYLRRMVVTTTLPAAARNSNDND